MYRYRDTSAVLVCLGSNLQRDQQSSSTHPHSLSNKCFSLDQYRAYRLLGVVCQPSMSRTPTHVPFQKRLSVSEHARLEPFTTVFPQSMTSYLRFKVLPHENLWKV